MPQETICAGCGATLYKGFDPEPPEETAKRHNGLCPNCGRKLSREPEEVEVISLIKELVVKAKFK
ncbi:TPA: hypothetical protein EYP26_06070 [Candidatus Bathyarchaeota archaeon]|nr:hypothetical protein [Candidatus Bathyarchaeota archaeon]